MKTFDFEDHAIVFDHTKGNLMVNATQMAKKFDKQVESFLRNDQTQAFISALLSYGNSRNSTELNNENSSNISDLNSRISDYLNIKTESDLYTSKQKTGTWMHRILAIKFAAWLDPKFEVWIYNTIDQILFGQYQTIATQMKEEVSLDRQIAELKEQMQESETYQQIERLELAKRQARYRRTKAIQNQLNLFVNK